MPAPETIASIKEKLNAERAKLLDTFTDVSRDVMVRPFEGSWSIKDVLAHMAMAEAVNIKFAKIMLAKEAPVQLKEFAAEYPDYPGEFELDKFNAWMAKRWEAKTLDEVLSAMNETRTDTLAWLDTLTPEQLERSGTHAAWGTLTVKGMFRILVIHDKFHRNDILKRKA